MNATRLGSLVHHDSQQSSLRIPLERVAYGILLCAALILRVAELDIAAFSEAEARQALAAWHYLFPGAPGTAFPADSVVTFWSQVFSFSILGASEFTARLNGVVAGSLLICMPLAFRRWIGSGGAFLAALLLAFSPVSIAAAREAQPSVWAAVFGLAALAAWRNAWETRNLTQSLLGIVWLAFLIFLSGNSGPVFALNLFAGFALAFIWVLLRSPLVLERPGDEVLTEFRAWLQSVPWKSNSLLTLLVLFVAATCFMVYPGGLNILGAALSHAVSGLFMTIHPGTEIALGLRTLVFYEPILVVFGIIAAIILHRRAQLGVTECFALTWLVSGAIIQFFYSNGQPAHALFLVLPLIILSLPLFRLLFTNIETALYWNGSLINHAADSDPFSQRYWWLKWVLGITVFAFCMMLGVHLQEIARGLLGMPSGIGLGDLVARALDVPMIQFRYSLLWLVITIMIALVTFLMVSSAFGPTNTLQGFGLGLFAFMLISGMGSGWNISVVRADNPAELWHRNATSTEMRLLRTTLQEISDRVTRGERQIPIAVVENDSGIHRDGVIAWTLRDYTQAQFYAMEAGARQYAAVIMGAEQTEPELGGSYVGQTFTIRRQWNQAINLSDFLGWFLQRSTRAESIRSDRLTLWLRMDVYDGFSLIDGAR